jgi:hypothetical protein
MIINDDTTGRFEVTEDRGRFMVRDLASQKPVRYSYDREAIPFASEQAATRWQNFYCARGFAQKLAALHA